MKKITVALILVLASGFAFGQIGVIGDSDKGIPPSPVTPLTPIQWRFKMVSWLMTFPSPLQVGAVQLHGMGDEAAFHIIGYLGTRSQLSTAETLTALDIIHNAFEVPISILNPADRKPTLSLRVLKTFQATAVDQTVKERIATETNFLNAVPATIIAPPMGVPGPRPAPGTTGLY